MKQLVIFIAGAVSGSFITWALIKDKYEKIAQEEIDSVKRVFSRRKPTSPEDDIQGEESVADEVDRYHEQLEKNGYTQYSDISTTKQKNEEDKIGVDKPYIIPPDDFGELDDYEKITLIYYTDGVLADDNDDLVEDIGEVVVEDFASHFGEYEDDSVFVRNDKLKCDYEILLDQGKYSDLPSVKFYNGAN